MKPDSALRQLNAIVGAALRAQAQAGVSDEELGAFALEHRAKVAAILGMEGADAPRSEADDLQEIIALAVEKALSRGTLQRRARKPRLVLSVGGRRTTVTISQELLDQAQQRAGGVKAARARIQALSDQLPPGAPENRSGWIEGQIQAWLALDRAVPAGSAHH